MNTRYGAGGRFAVPAPLLGAFRLRRWSTAAQPAALLHPPPAAQGGWARLSPPVRVGGIKKWDTPVGVSHFLVPVTGLEPVRCRQRWILSPLRLPIPSHRQVCFAFLSASHRWLFIVAAFRRRMSPSFAVPGALLGAFRLRRSPTAAPATPSLYPPLAALGLASVDFESTTSTNSITPAEVFAGCSVSIHHLFQNSKHKNPNSQLFVICKE